jgi:hypothetical protein
MKQSEIKQRLEYLRGEIDNESISMGEIAELQSLAEHIDDGDVVLLQWAGVPEGSTWKVTDPSCNQMMKVLGEQVFLFKEDRIVNPETKETEIYESKIDLSEYTQEQMFDSVRTFGYSFNEMCTWIDEGTNLSLIAECIFETKSYNLNNNETL